MTKYFVIALSFPQGGWGAGFVEGKGGQPTTYHHAYFNTREDAELWLKAITGTDHAKRWREDNLSTNSLLLVDDFPEGPAEARMLDLIKHERLFAKPLHPTEGAQAGRKRA